MITTASDIRRYRRRGYGTALALMLVSLVCVGSAAARPVNLPDATRAPDSLTQLQPRASVTVRVRCSLSDLSAYVWNGQAMGAQRWTRSRTLMYWNHPRTGRVTYTPRTRTFTNRTRHRVLVAAWCG